MRRAIAIATSCVLAVLAAVSSAFAEVPQMINYQGRLTNNLGNPVANNTYEVTFRIYDELSIQRWIEVHNITTVTGLFSVQLGSNGQPLTEDVFNYDECWLGITVTGDAEITPRTRLITVPYAMRVAAVHSSEILNGPGIASAMSVDDIELNRTEMTDIETVSIVIPSSGYILVQGQCYVTSLGSTNWNYIYVQIDETSGGTYTEPYCIKAGMGTFPSENSHSFPVFVQRVYYKSAGTYTFRMEGQSSGYFHTSHADCESMTALYVPTGYGPISSNVPDAAGFEDAVPAEMTVHGENQAVNEAMYEAGLRELELKAARLRAASLEAERELLEAQIQQNLDDQSE
jgi:hypothetical protein